MSVESLQPNIEKEKKEDDQKSLVEHLNNLRLIVGRVLSGDIETGTGVSSTGSRRFDPQNQTTRTAVAGDDSSASDDSNGTTDPQSTVKNPKS